MANGAVKKKSQRWRELSDAQAVVIAAFIAICPPIISGGIAAIATIKFIKVDPLEKARQRIESSLPPRVGFTRQVYPTLGLGFLLPGSWTVEDAAVKFGGEVDCVKRYEDTKGIVGVKLRIRTVQRNYINDLGAEIQNQVDVWKKIDPNLVVGDIALSGQPAKTFSYKQPTGLRVGDIRVYWIRLLPQVKLEILGFVYMDSADKDEFWRELDSIVQTLVLDRPTFDHRASEL